MSPLASLLFWAAFLPLMAWSMWSMLRRHIVSATLPSYSAAFRSEPGHLVYRQFVSVRGQRYVYETFVVAVAAAPAFNFNLKSKAPPAMRPSTMEGYSDGLAAKLLDGMFKFKRRGAFPDWERAQLSLVAVALSSIPLLSGGTLEARQGRLVAKWSRRLTQLEFSRLPATEPASVVARAEKVLVQLAADLVESAPQRCTTEL